jgi:hypothetical protein
MHNFQDGPLIIQIYYLFGFLAAPLNLKTAKGAASLSKALQ